MSRCSRERALHAVEALSELGARSAGTPSGHASAAWVARRLRGLGLQPVVTEDPERWAYEGRVARLTVTAGPGTEGAESLILSRAAPFLFSPASSGSASLSTGLPSSGAYVGARVPRSKEAGAVPPSLILVDPGDDWPRERSLRAGASNKTPTLAIAQHEGEWIRRCLGEERELRLDWELHASARLARARTVIATLPARPGAPEGFFLITAHGDSFGGGHGVNGNASGVAVLLEVARAWSAAVREGAIPSPAREVRFAVWGSRAHSPRVWLSEHLKEQTEPLLGVLNLQNLALSSGGHRLHMEPDDHPANSALIQHACAQLNDAAGRSGLPERWVTSRSRGAGGLSPFLHSPSFAPGGIPAMTLFAAGSSEIEEVEGTLGQPGESWRDLGVVTIPHDPMLGTRGDADVSRIKDDGALLEAAARTVLAILPSWLESLPA